MKEKSSSIKKIAIALAIISLLFFTFFFSEVFRKKTEHLLLSSLNFIFKPISDFKFLLRDIGAGLEEKLLLKEENERLKEELELFKTKVLKTEILSRELEDLEKNFGRLKFYEAEPIIARITFRPPEVFFDSFVLDAGENDGVKKNMKVIAYGEIFIGRIEKVFPNTSLVSLLSKFNYEENVILEKSGSAVIMKGNANHEMVIELPGSFGVEVGELVYTLTPKPYLIGIVEKIEYQEANPLKKIFIKFPFNERNLHTVFLIE